MTKFLKMNLKTFICLVFLSLWSASFLSAQYQPYSSDGNPSTAGEWVATDALGRELPSSDEVGDKRPGKLVGMFYFIWTGIQLLTGGSITGTNVNNGFQPEGDNHSPGGGAGDEYHGISQCHQKARKNAPGKNRVIPPGGGGSVYFQTSYFGVIGGLLLLL
jgi:hypothetical protein